jgi:hypothetical protein
MATITISDLHPAGADFFSDSENYLNDLTDDELEQGMGGASPTVSSWFCLTVIGYWAGYAWGRWGSGGC